MYNNNGRRDGQFPIDQAAGHLALATHPSPSHRSFKKLGTFHDFTKNQLNFTFISAENPTQNFTHHQTV